MSEKIYAWLLRVYPLRFRERCGDAAVQLFRDRWRDERGFWPRLRLWLDLLRDLAISVPRQYGREPALMPASAPHSDGTPVFHVFEGESPRLGALLMGGVLSLSAVAASIPISHLAPHTTRRPSGFIFASFGAHAPSPAQARHRRGLRLAPRSRRLER